MSIYNPKLKCVYVNIPRTGCGSIGKIIGGGGHWPLAEFKKQGRMKEIDFDKLFKFTFVRNPYDRFVSAYYNLGLDEEKNINDYIQNGLSELFEVEKTLFRPQVDWIVEDGKILVDFVGRYEDLEKDWKKIQKKLKIKDKLPHVNETKRKKVELNEESKRVLREVYKEDFEMFDYAKITTNN